MNDLVDNTQVYALLQSMAPEAPVPSSKNNLLFFTEAFYVAGVTLIGYLSAFLYQYGYFAQFNIPTHLIEIRTGNVLSVASLAFFILFPIMGYLVRTFKLESTWTYKKRIYLLLAFLVICFGPILLFVFDPNHLGVSLALIVCCLALASTFVLTDHYEYRHKHEDKLITPDVIRRQLFLLFKTPVGLAFVGMFLLDSFMAGGFVARNQPVFWISDTNPANAIIASSGDYLIGVEFDPATRKVTGSTLLNKADISAQKAKFAPQKVGPLISENKMNVNPFVQLTSLYF